VADVGLCAPTEHQRCPVRADGLDGDRAGRLEYGVAKRVEVQPERCEVGRSVRTVEPDRGVEVDQAAPLVLGDFGVGEPGVLAEPPARNPEPDGEGTAQGNGEAVPEAPGVRLPQHGAGVVVGVRVERGAERRVVLAVMRPAAARDHSAAGRDASGVHRPERGRGEGEEQAWFAGDRGRDALVSSGEAGADEVEGVTGVPVRAGRADGGAAVAARSEDLADPFDERGAVTVEDLREAGKSDRVRAAAGGFDLGPPVPVVVRAQPCRDCVSGVERRRLRRRAALCLMQPRALARGVRPPAGPRAARGCHRATTW